jgi:glucokinase
MQDGDVAIGVDVGGTKVAAGIVEVRDGRALLGIRARGNVDPATNAGGISSIFAVVDNVFRHLDAGQRSRLVGIGVACAGNVDHVHGTLRRASNMAWVDLAIAPALRDRYSFDGGVRQRLEARVENDVNAAAWGLSTFPDGAILPSKPTLAYLVVGTGIGAGIVDGGRILRGRIGGAGELGHLPGIAGAVDPVAGRVPCTCGARGCLEAVASGPALGAAGRQRAISGGAPGLLKLASGDPSRIDAMTVTAAATAGDPDALDLIAREGRFIALAIAVAFRAYDPHRVVIGGGVVAGGAVVVDAIHAGIADLAVRDDHRLRAARTWLEVKTSSDDGGIVGGASLVLSPPT